MNPRSAAVRMGRGYILLFNLVPIIFKDWQVLAPGKNRDKRVKCHRFEDDLLYVCLTLESGDDLLGRQTVKGICVGPVMVSDQHRCL